MYLGSLVEEAETELLFEKPLHPYTQALFSSVPDFAAGQRKPEILEGERPMRTDEFKGCVFHTRCRMNNFHISFRNGRFGYLMWIFCHRKMILVLKKQRIS